MSDIHEQVGPKVGENIRREAREAVREASEGIVKKLTDRGFRDEDVRKHVREGAFDGVIDLREKK